MKTKKSKLIFAIVLCTSFTCSANPGMPPPGLPPTGDPVDATINDNIFVLIGLGIILGLFFIMNKNERQLLSA